MPAASLCHRGMLQPRGAMGDKLGRHLVGKEHLLTMGGSVLGAEASLGALATALLPAEKARGWGGSLRGRLRQTGLAV